MRLWAARFSGSPRRVCVIVTFAGSDQEDGGVQPLAGMQLTKDLPGVLRNSLINSQRLFIFSESGGRQ